MIWFIYSESQLVLEQQIREVFFVESSLCRLTYVFVTYIRTCEVYRVNQITLKYPKLLNLEQYLQVYKITDIKRGV